MYDIQSTNYGFKLTFAGFIKEEEMKQWAAEFKQAVDKLPRKFQVFVDMRHLNPLPKEAQPHMEDGQKHARQKGMERSVVIIDNVITKLQFVRIAKETGIYQWERYIDASSVSDFEKVGLDWLLKAKDPDKS